MYVCVYIPLKNIFAHRYGKVPNILAHAMKIIAFNSCCLQLLLNQTVCPKWTKVRLYTPDITLSVSL